MKNKHIGLVGLVLVGLAVFVLVSELMWASWHQVSPFALSSALDSYSSERLLVDAGAVSQMDLVEPALPNLVKPEQFAGSSELGEVSDVNYAMLGLRSPVVAIETPAAPKVPVDPESSPYRIAMTYVSGEHRYAVVDKKFYQQGANLPNGEHLAEISDSAVRIVSVTGSESRWIPIQTINKL